MENERGENGLSVGSITEKGGMAMSLEHSGREEAAGPQLAVGTMAAAAERQVMEWGGRTAGNVGEQPGTPGFPSAGHKGTASRVYLFSFAVSVLLTLLAFGAALYGELPADLLVPFLMLMAVIQLVQQLVYWTRLKGRSDALSILSLVFGTLITLAALGAALYWVWV